MEVQNPAHCPALIEGSGNGGKGLIPISDSKIIIYQIDAGHVYFFKMYPVGLRLKNNEADVFEVLSD